MTPQDAVKTEDKKTLLKSMIKAVEELIRSIKASEAVRGFLGANHPSMHKLAAAPFEGSNQYRRALAAVDKYLQSGSDVGMIGNLAKALAPMVPGDRAEVERSIIEYAKGATHSSERSKANAADTKSAMAFLTDKLAEDLYGGDKSQYREAIGSLENHSAPTAVMRSMSRMVSKGESIDSVYDAYSDFVSWVTKNKDKLKGFFRLAGNSLSNIASPPLRKSKASMRKAVQFLHNGDTIMSEGSLVPEGDSREYKETPAVNESSRMWAALSAMFNNYDPENPDASKISFAAISAAGTKDKDARRGPRILDSLSQEHVVLLGYGGPKGDDHKVYKGDIGRALLDPAAAPYIFTVNTNEIRLSDRTNSTPHHLIPGTVYTATPGALGVAGKKISKSSDASQSLAFILDGQSVKEEDLELHALEFPKFLTYAASSFEALNNNIARKTHRLDESTGEVEGKSEGYDVSEDSLAEDPSDFEYMKDKSGNMALVHRKMNADREHSLQTLRGEGEKVENRANLKELNDYLVSYAKRRYDKTEETKEDIVSTLHGLIATQPSVDRLLSTVQNGESLPDFLVSLGNSKEVQGKLVSAILSDALEFPYDSTSYAEAVTATKALIEMSEGNITDAARKVVEAISSTGKMDSKYIALFTSGGKKSVPFKVENYRTKVQPVLNNILHGALFESLSQSNFKEKIRTLTAPVSTNLHKRLVGDPETQQMNDREFFSRVLAEVRNSDKVFNKFVDTAIDCCRDLIYEAYAKNNDAEGAEAVGGAPVDPELLRQQRSTLDTEEGHTPSVQSLPPGAGASVTKLAAAPSDRMEASHALAWIRMASLKINKGKV